MGKCSFELWEKGDNKNKEKCGLPIGGGSSTRCAFHAHVDQALPLTNSSIISDYIELCKSEYLKERKREYLDLTRARFQGIHFNRVSLPSDIEVRFNKSEFEDCRFTGLSFQESVSFRECVFLRTPFRDIDIKAAAVDFERSTMSGLTVQFEGCDFQCTKAIAFVGAHIESGTNPFSGCFFEAPQIQFLDCTLNTDRLYVLIVGSADLLRNDRYLALAGEEIYFDGLKLNGHFEYANPIECREVSPIVKFSQVNFRQMKTAIFFEANLKRARFTYSVLHNVEFRNPRFEESSGRKQIYDEIVRVDDTDEEHIRDVYIQLKRNFEEAHNYADAGDWFYREMECRRRLAEANRSKHPWLGLPSVILYRLYKFVSEYGENYARPFWGLIATLLFGATSYFYSGFGTEGTTNYDLAWPPTVDSFWGFTDAMLYSLGVMSFQVTKTGFQHGTSTTAVTLAQVVFTLILVPLFLLALRRKFRR